MVYNGINLIILLIIYLTYLHLLFQIIILIDKYSPSNVNINNQAMKVNMAAEAYIGSLGQSTHVLEYLNLCRGGRPLSYW